MCTMLDKAIQCEGKKKFKDLNPEERKKYFKIAQAKYYEKNKNNMLDKMKKPIYCEYCNKEYALGNTSHHMRSKFHKMNVELYNMKNINNKDNQQQQIIV